MGKTVLLNAFARQARGVELTVVRIEAGRGRSFEELLAAGVRLRERDGRASGLVLLIDEAQNLGTRGLEDLAAWIAARRALGSSVWAAAAGLPFESRDTKAGNEKSFMRFAVDVLTQDETRFAFEETLRREGSSIESAALAYLTTRSGEYPYFVQELGAHTWNAAQDAVITLEDARRGCDAAVRTLTEGLLRVRAARSDAEGLAAPYLKALLGDRT